MYSLAFMYLCRLLLCHLLVNLLVVFFAVSRRAVNRTSFFFCSVLRRDEMDFSLVDLGYAVSFPMMYGLWTLLQVVCAQMSA